jgi:uncharacterized protein YbjT (DUF2867 family)
VVRLSPALFQPIASDDVVANLAELTLAPPLNGTFEVAGPEALPRTSSRANSWPRAATSAR